MIKIKDRSILKDVTIKIIIVIALSIFLIVAFNSYLSKQIVLDSVGNYTLKQDEIAQSIVIESIEEIGRIESFTKPIYEEFGVNNHFLKEQLTLLISSSKLVNFIKIKNKDNEISFYEITSPENFIRSTQTPTSKDAKIALFETSSLKTTLSFFDENSKFLEQTDETACNTPFDDNSDKTWSDIFIYQNQPYMTYTAPRSSNNSSNMLTVSLDLNGLSTLLNNGKLVDGARIFVLDEQNNILADSDIISSDSIRTVNNEKNERIKIAVEGHYKNIKSVDRVFSFNYKGKLFLSTVSEIPKRTGLKWKILTIITASDLVDDFKKVEKMSFLFSIIILLLIIVLLYFQINRLSDPITHLSIETDKIKNLELEDPISINSRLIEVNKLSHALSLLKINVSNFSKFIPKDLVKKFIDKGEQVGIGGTSNNITLFFSDIEGFTTISEKTPPTELMYQLSEYFEYLSSIILENSGTIDKFIGDAIMAFWGAPNPDDLQVVHACRSALMCQQKLRSLNKYWVSKKRMPLVTRIGIHYGTAVVGNVGCSERLNYTALGDNVNLAARLEGINKLYGTYIIVSQAVVDVLPDTFIVRPLDIVAVKGKEKGIKIYELIGENDHDYVLPISQETKEYAKQFNEAFDLYLNRDWENAQKMFNALKNPDVNPNHYQDILLDQYIDRCHDLINNPPSIDWDGIMHLKQK